MEQEIGYIHVSPPRVRRQLLFITPTKKVKLQDPRTEEIQKTPKCKMSKSKVIEKISKKKFVIDFDVEKNYFLDDIDTGAYFKAEEDNFTMPQEPVSYGSFIGNTTPNWICTSPYKTAKKPRISPANMSEFTSVIKGSILSKSTTVPESPFCRLLNESDQFTIEKYQHLSRSDYDNDNDGLTDQFSDQVKIIENFFKYFEQRSSNIMDLFTQDSIFEIIGEPKIHSLNISLNAVAKVFLKFEYELGALDFNYKFAASDDQQELIITTTGRLIAHGFQPNFILSAKISVEKNLIKHLKLKLC